MTTNFADRFAGTAHRAVVITALLALLLAACGGGTSGDASETTTTTAGSAAGDEDPPTTTANPVDTTEPDDNGGDGTPDPGAQGDLSLVPEGETDIVGNPAGQGFVELDGVRYDFILNGACQKLFGAVQASGSPADGSDAKVDAIIPPEDWETDPEVDWDPPYVEVEIGDDSWRAEAGSQHLAGGENLDLTAEQSAVTSFSNNGALVSGEAIFFSEYNYDEVETATGTFEFYCP
jgi:hypothetical protein